jgi:flagellar protein FliO/FliZ
MEESVSSLSSSGPISSSGIIEMLGGLIFVVLLIFALAWLFKRMGSNSFGLGGVIRVLAAMSLGNRDRIALIEVGEKQMLIGISPGRISTLHVFDEPVELAEGRVAVDSDFASKLQSMLSGTRS